MVNDGISRVVQAAAGVVEAIALEGAGPLVSQAAGRLAEAISVRGDDGPIAHFGLYTDGAAHFRRMSVQELMDDNAGFESSAWFWIDEMLGGGLHDDSDLRSGVISLYMLTDRQRLREDALTWAAANEEIVAGSDDIDPAALPI